MIFPKLNAFMVDPSKETDELLWLFESILRSTLEFGETIDSVAWLQQAFQSALGIVSLSKKYGSERVEKASIKALKIKSHRYQTLKTMLKNNMEDADLSKKGEALSSELNEQLGLFAKENLRVQSYYH